MEETAWQPVATSSGSSAWISAAALAALEKAERVVKGFQEHTILYFIYHNILYSTIIYHIVLQFLEFGALHLHCPRLPAWRSPAAPPAPIT